MSNVRVVARIRPLQSTELSKDTIISSTTSTITDKPVVRIPNPRNPAENFSFHFNAVYDHEASQQDLFDGEVAPTVKHLFNGFDVTIFAYGVTGTGKTHTMRGGKSLAERGVIPRMLSAIYRRGRKVEKDSAGAKKIQVTMSYYEIYCDKVFDLFEPPEKRTPAGLPIRDCNGKTVVAGLTERPCETLKEFEVMYDETNRNRSTGATKLNAHSSRSHAILCVKVAQIEGDKVITSTASAIDLAGSEDNRRTENGKERLVESSAINKSLFVLAQCVEAISKKQARIPYRESKMTRILALGQNNGLTLMILNLSPVRSYHLDTLSSLQFANRTKKIEVREVENEPIFLAKQEKPAAAIRPAVNRQPLRSLSAAINAAVKPSTTNTIKDKPLKAFVVYTEKSSAARPSYGRKRQSDENVVPSGRPAKMPRTSGEHRYPAVTTNKSNDHISRADLECLVNRMVEEKLAERTLDAAQPSAAPLSSDVQRRLEALEQRVDSQAQLSVDDERSEGLQYLLMAKQHQVRGELASALRMFKLAAPYFPGNEKLRSRMMAIEQKLANQKHVCTDEDVELIAPAQAYAPARPAISKEHKKAMQVYTEDDYNHEAYDDDNDNNDDRDDDDEDYNEPSHISIDDDEETLPATKKSSKARPQHTLRSTPFSSQPQTPRTKALLRIINTKDVSVIKSLKGVGVKKAEGIVNGLFEMQGVDGVVAGLDMLAAIRGVGVKGVEKMREGIAAVPELEDEVVTHVGQGFGCTSSAIAV